MLTTNKRLGGSLSGSMVLLTTPTGQTDWLWKSTFTLQEINLNVVCTFTLTVLTVRGGKLYLLLLCHNITLF